VIATLEHNPRVLASPDDAPLPGDIGERLAVAELRQGWCIALDAVEPIAVAELQRTEQHGARILVQSGGPPFDLHVCLPRGEAVAALDGLLDLSVQAQAMHAALVGAVTAYERDAWTLRCGERRLAVGGRTLVMGIVNVTPDSFSDGGEFYDPATAIAHGRRLADEGADILDIGGESTRPGAGAVGVEEECERVLPVIEALADGVDVPISIDTSKAEVARRAVGAGAAMINDVTALRGDPDLARVAADARVPVVLMHMKGTPRTMQKDPRYDDLMGEIVAALRGSMALAVRAGVPEDQLVVDPGIGFGKTVKHNLAILRWLPQLRSLGCPILLGTSRKSFIGAITGAEVTDRVLGTAATVACGIARGARIVRVHDVAQMRQVAQMTDAILGR